MPALLGREHVWRIYDLDRAGLSQADIGSEIAEIRGDSTISESTIGRLLRRARGFGDLEGGGGGTLEPLARRTPRSGRGAGAG